MIKRCAEAGVTYLELLATATILMILAAAMVPTVRVAVKRQKEMELRRALRQIRLALDKYLAYCDPNVQSPDPQNRHLAKQCIDTKGPEKLTDLVEGVELANAVPPNNKVKFLRRIPIDPMTGKNDTWVARCYSQRADETSWCGTDVWDVRSASTQKGMNGRPYNEW